MSLAEYTRQGGLWTRPGRPPLFGTKPYFQAADWMWNPIPASPVLDPMSATWNGTFNADAEPKVLDMIEFGVPLYEILPGETAPTYTVHCTEFGARDMVCRIPDGAAPSPASDAAMCIIDYPLGLVYEFWVVYKTGSVWGANYGSIYPIDGVGRDDADVGIGPIGAGHSRTLGVLTKRDFENGFPNGDAGHALVFSSDSSAPTVFRYPAVKTDGSNLTGAANPVPEGARVQINPAYDVEGSAQSPLGKFITRTLQKYGAYNIDNGGARMAFIVQGDDPAQAEYDPPNHPGDSTGSGGWARDYGITFDYFGLMDVPWDQLRVLKKWDGTA